MFFSKTFDLFVLYVRREKEEYLVRSEIWGGRGGIVNVILHKTEVGHVWISNNISTTSENNFNQQRALDRKRRLFAQIIANMPKAPLFLAHSDQIWYLSEMGLGGKTECFCPKMRPILALLPPFPLG